MEGVQRFFEKRMSMEEKNNNSNRNIVGGYCFGTAQDAEMARQEEKKIEYLESHMDYGKTENMLLVYKKAIESRIFSTPIGWEYLKKIQNELNRRDDLKEEVPPIGLYTVFAHRTADEIKVPAPRIPQKKEKRDIRRGMIASVIINVMLAAAVAAMFYIALTSDNPNILNYENNLQNKYAQWEQELTERENAVREKERNLMIDQ